MIAARGDRQRHAGPDMNAERADAYGRVMDTLRELGPSKLLAGEQDAIRGAADSLLFSRDARGDQAAHDALRVVERLCRALVDSGRWTEQAAERLADDVAGCGPALLPELRAA